MRLSEHAGLRRLTPGMCLLLPLSLAAAYIHTLAAMWARWFPAWNRKGAGLYDRIVAGESYYTHGPLTFLVSLIAASLLIRWRRIPLKPMPWLGGALLLAALAVHLASSLGRVMFISAFSLVAALAAMIVMLWGAGALRRLWFPLALLLFAAPLPEVTIAELNFKLKMTAAEWGVGLANALGVAAARSGNLVFLEGDEELVITNVCSGLRTLISLLAFGAIYTYVCRLRGWRRLGLFVLALPVAVASNTIRILSLIVVARIFGAPAAVGWYHDFSGLMIFALAVAMMFGLERLLLACGGQSRAPEQFRRDPGASGQWRTLAAALRSRSARAATVMLVLAAAAAWPLHARQTPGAPASVLSATLPTEVELEKQIFHSCDLALDERTLTVLESPDYLYRRYFPGGGEAEAMDFCLVRGRDNRKAVHPPDLCLEGGGTSIVSKADVIVPGVAGRGDVPCRELVVRAAGQLHYYIYVYKCGGGYTRNFWRQQLVIFADSLLSRKACGALIRISTPIRNQQIEKARQMSFALLRQSIPHVDRALP